MLSAKTEYACIAVLELARHYPREQPLRGASIAAAHGIPANFLVQILLQLKAVGIVVSTRGAAGGYLLARDPDTISLADVMSAVEGSPGKFSSSAAAETPLSRVLGAAWEEATEAQQRVLAGVSFADLARKVQGEEAMYYI
jgi:Rrf2 family protein